MANMQKPFVREEQMKGVTRIQVGKGCVARITDNIISKFKFKLMQSYFDDNFNAHLAKSVALECLRRVKSRRRCVREIPIFADTVRNFIFFLHEYNMNVFKSSNFYPFSHEFSELLHQYVLLECQILYKRSYFSKEREIQAHDRTLRLLLNIFNDYFKCKMTPRKEVIEKSAKAIFDIFIELNLNYPNANKFRLLERMTGSLLKKIGRYDKVNAFKNKCVPSAVGSAKDPDLLIFSTNVMTSDYGSDESSNGPTNVICIDDEEDFNKHSVEEPTVEIKPEPISSCIQSQCTPKPNMVWTICLDDDDDDHDDDDDIIFLAEEVQSKRETINKNKNTEVAIKTHKVDYIIQRDKSPQLPKVQTDIPMSKSKVNKINYVDRLQQIDNLLDNGTTHDDDDSEEEDLKPDINTIVFEEGLTNTKGNNRSLPISQREVPGESSNRSVDLKNKTGISRFDDILQQVNINGSSKNGIEEEKDCDEKPFVELLRQPGTSVIVDIIDLIDDEDEEQDPIINLDSHALPLNRTNPHKNNDSINEADTTDVSSSCIVSSPKHVVSHCDSEISTTTDIEIMSKKIVNIHLKSHSTTLNNSNHVEEAKKNEPDSSRSNMEVVILEKNPLMQSRNIQDLYLNEIRQGIIEEHVSLEEIKAVERGLTPVEEFKEGMKVDTINVINLEKEDQAVDENNKETESIMDIAKQLNLVETAISKNREDETSININNKEIEDNIELKIKILDTPKNYEVIEEIEEHKLDQTTSKNINETAKVVNIEEHGVISILDNEKLDKSINSQTIEDSAENKSISTTNTYDNGTSVIHLGKDQIVSSCPSKQEIVNDYISTEPIEEDSDILYIDDNLVEEAIPEIINSDEDNTPLYPQNVEKITNSSKETNIIDDKIDTELVIPLTSLSIQLQRINEENLTASTTKIPPIFQKTEETIVPEHAKEAKKNEPGSFRSNTEAVILEKNNLIQSLQDLHIEEHINFKEIKSVERGSTPVGEINEIIKDGSVNVINLEHEAKAVGRENHDENSDETESHVEQLDLDETIKSQNCEDETSINNREIEDNVDLKKEILVSPKNCEVIEENKLDQTANDSLINETATDINNEEIGVNSILDNETLNKSINSPIIEDSAENKSILTTNTYNNDTSVINLGKDKIVSSCPTKEEIVKDDNSTEPIEDSDILYIDGNLLVVEEEISEIINSDEDQSSLYPQNEENVETSSNENDILDDKFDAVIPIASLSIELKRINEENLAATATEISPIFQKSEEMIVPEHVKEAKKNELDSSRSNVEVVILKENHLIQYKNVQDLHIEENINLEEIKSVEQGLMSVEEIKERVEDGSVNVINLEHKNKAIDMGNDDENNEETESCMVIVELLDLDKTGTSKNREDETSINITKIEDNFDLNKEILDSPKNYEVIEDNKLDQTTNTNDSLISESAADINNEEIGVYSVLHNEKLDKSINSEIIEDSEENKSIPTTNTNDNDTSVINLGKDKIISSCPTKQEIVNDYNSNEPVEEDSDILYIDDNLLVVEEEITEIINSDEDQNSLYPQNEEHMENSSKENILDDTSTNINNKEIEGNVDLKKEILDSLKNDEVIEENKLDQSTSKNDSIIYETATDIKNNEEIGVDSILNNEKPDNSINSEIIEDSEKNKLISTANTDTSVINLEKDKIVSNCPTKEEIVKDDHSTEPIEEDSDILYIDGNLLVVEEEIAEIINCNEDQTSLYHRNQENMETSSKENNIFDDKIDTELVIPLTSLSIQLQRINKENLKDAAAEMPPIFQKTEEASVPEHVDDAKKNEPDSSRSNMETVILKGNHLIQSKKVQELHIEENKNLEDIKAVERGLTPVEGIKEIIENGSVNVINLEQEDNVGREDHNENNKKIESRMVIVEQLDLNEMVASKNREDDSININNKEIKDNVDLKKEKLVSPKNYEVIEENKLDQTTSTNDSLINETATDINNKIEVDSILDNEKLDKSINSQIVEDSAENKSISTTNTYDNDTSVINLGKDKIVSSCPTKEEIVKDDNVTEPIEEDSDILYIDGNLLVVEEEISEIINSDEDQSSLYPQNEEHMETSSKENNILDDKIDAVIPIASLSIQLEHVNEENLTGATPEIPPIFQKTEEIIVNKQVEVSASNSTEDNMHILAIAAEIKRKSEKTCFSNNKKKTKKTKNAFIKTTGDPQNNKDGKVRITRSKSRKSGSNTIESIMKPQDFTSTISMEKVKIHQVSELIRKKECTDTDPRKECTDTDSNDSESNKLFISIYDSDTPDENLKFSYEVRSETVKTKTTPTKKTQKLKTAAERKSYSPIQRFSEATKLVTPEIPIGNPIASLIDNLDVPTMKLPKKLQLKYELKAGKNFESSQNNFGDHVSPTVEQKSATLPAKIRHKLDNSRTSDSVTIDLSKKKNTVKMTAEKLGKRLEIEIKNGSVNVDDLTPNRAVDTENMPLTLRLKTVEIDSETAEAIDLTKREEKTEVTPKKEIKILSDIIISPSKQRAPETNTVIVPTDNDIIEIVSTEDTQQLLSRSLIETPVENTDLNTSQTPTRRSFLYEEKEIDDLIDKYTKDDCIRIAKVKFKTKLNFSDDETVETLNSRSLRSSRSKSCLAKVQKTKGDVERKKTRSKSLNDHGHDKQSDREKNQTVNRKPSSVVSDKKNTESSNKKTVSDAGESIVGSKPCSTQAQKIDSNSLRKRKPYKLVNDHKITESLNKTEKLDESSQFPREAQNFDSHILKKTKSSKMVPENKTSELGHETVSKINAESKPYLTKAQKLDSHSLKNRKPSKLVSDNKNTELVNKTVSDMAESIDESKQCLTEAQNLNKHSLGKMKQSKVANDHQDNESVNKIVTVELVNASKPCPIKPEKLDNHSIRNMKPSRLLSDTEKSVSKSKNCPKLDTHLLRKRRPKLVTDHANADSINITDSDTAQLIDDSKPCQPVPQHLYKHSLRRKKQSKMVTEHNEPDNKVVANTAEFIGEPKPFPTKILKLDSHSIRNRNPSRLASDHKNDETVNKTVSDLSQPINESKSCPTEAKKLDNQTRQPSKVNIYKFDDPKSCSIQLQRLDSHLLRRMKLSRVATDHENDTTINKTVFDAAELVDNTTVNERVYDIYEFVDETKSCLMQPQKLKSHLLSKKKLSGVATDHENDTTITKTDFDTSELVELNSSSTEAQKFNNRSLKKKLRSTHITDHKIKELIVTTDKHVQILKLDPEEPQKIDDNSSRNLKRSKDENLSRKTRRSRSNKSIIVHDNTNVMKSETYQKVKDGLSKNRRRSRHLSEHKSKQTNNSENYSELKEHHQLSAKKLRSRSLSSRENQNITIETIVDIAEEGNQLSAKKLGPRSLSSHENKDITETIVNTSTKKATNTTQSYSEKNQTLRKSRSKSLIERENKAIADALSDTIKAINKDELLKNTSISVTSPDADSKDAAKAANDQSKQKKRRSKSVSTSKTKQIIDNKKCRLECQTAGNKVESRSISSQENVLKDSAKEQKSKKSTSKRPRKKVIVDFDASSIIKTGIRDTENDPSNVIDKTNIKVDTAENVPNQNMDTLTPNTTDTDEIAQEPINVSEICTLVEPTDVDTDKSTGYCLETITAAHNSIIKETKINMQAEDIENHTAIADIIPEDEFSNANTSITSEITASHLKGQQKRIKRISKKRRLHPGSEENQTEDTVVPDKKQIEDLVGIQYQNIPPLAFPSEHNQFLAQINLEEKGIENLIASEEMQVLAKNDVRNSLEHYTDGKEQKCLWQSQKLDESQHLLTLVDDQNSSLVLSSGVKEQECTQLLNTSKSDKMEDLTTSKTEEIKVSVEGQIQNSSVLPDGDEAQKHKFPKQSLKSDESEHVLISEAEKIQGLEGNEVKNSSVLSNDAELQEDIIFSKQGQKLDEIEYVVTLEEKEDETCILLDNEVQKSLVLPINGKQPECNIIDSHIEDVIISKTEETHLSDSCMLVDTIVTDVDTGCCLETSTDSKNQAIIVDIIPEDELPNAIASKSSEITISDNLEDTKSCKLTTSDLIKRLRGKEKRNKRNSKKPLIGKEHDHNETVKEETIFEVQSDQKLEQEYTPLESEDVDISIVQPKISKKQEMQLLNPDSEENETQDNLPEANQIEDLVSIQYQNIPPLAALPAEHNQFLKQTNLEEKGIENLVATEEMQDLAENNIRNYLELHTDGKEQECLPKSQKPDEYQHLLIDDRDFPLSGIKKQECTQMLTHTSKSDKIEDLPISQTEEMKVSVESHIQNSSMPPNSDEVQKPKFTTQSPKLKSEAEEIQGLDDNEVENSSVLSDDTTLQEHTIFFKQSQKSDEIEYVASIEKEETQILDNSEVKNSSDIIQQECNSIDSQNRSTVETKDVITLEAEETHFLVDGYVQNCAILPNDTGEQENKQIPESYCKQSPRADAIKDLPTLEAEKTQILVETRVQNSSQFSNDHEKNLLFTPSPKADEIKDFTTTLEAEGTEFLVERKRQNYSVLPNETEEHDNKSVIHSPKLDERKDSTGLEAEKLQVLVESQVQNNSVFSYNQEQNRPFSPKADEIKDLATLETEETQVLVEGKIQNYPVFSKEIKKLENNSYLTQNPKANEIRDLTTLEADETLVLVESQVRNYSLFPHDQEQNRPFSPKSDEIKDFTALEAEETQVLVERTIQNDSVLPNEIEELENNKHLTQNPKTDKRRDLTTLEADETQVLVECQVRNYSLFSHDQEQNRPFSPKSDEIKDFTAFEAEETQVLVERTIQNDSVLPNEIEELENNRHLTQNPKTDKRRDLTTLEADETQVLVECQVRNYSLFSHDQEQNRLFSPKSDEIKDFTTLEAEETQVLVERKIQNDSVLPNEIEELENNTHLTQNPKTDKIRDYTTLEADETQILVESQVQPFSVLSSDTEEQEHNTQSPKADEIQSLVASENLVELEALPNETEEHENNIYFTHSPKTDEIIELATSEEGETHASVETQIQNSSNLPNETAEHEDNSYFTNNSKVDEIKDLKTLEIEETQALAHNVVQNSSLSIVEDEGQEQTNCMSPHSHSEESVKEVQDNSHLVLNVIKDQLLPQVSSTSAPREIESKHEDILEQLDSEIQEIERVKINKLICNKDHAVKDTIVQEEVKLFDRYLNNQIHQKGNLELPIVCQNEPKLVPTDVFDCDPSSVQIDALKKEEIKETGRIKPEKKVQKRKTSILNIEPLCKKCKSTATTDFKNICIITGPVKQKQKTADVPSTSYEEMPTPQAYNPLLQQISYPMASNEDNMTEFSNDTTLANTSSTEVDADVLPNEIMELLWPLNWIPPDQRQQSSRYRDRIPPAISIVSSRSTISTTYTNYPGTENILFSPEQNKNGGIATITSKQEITSNHITLNFNGRRNQNNPHEISMNDNLAMEHCYSQGTQMAGNADSNQLKAIKSGTNDDHNYNTRDPVMSMVYNGDDAPLNYDNIFGLDLLEEDDSLRGGSYPNWDPKPKVIVVPNEQYSEDSELKDFDKSSAISETIDDTLVVEPWDTNELIKNEADSLVNETWNGSESLKGTQNVVSSQWPSVPIKNIEVEIPFTNQENSCSNSINNNQETYETIGSCPNNLYNAILSDSAPDSYIWTEIPFNDEHQQEFTLPKEPLAQVQEESQTPPDLSFYTTNFTSSPEADCCETPQEVKEAEEVVQDETTNEPWDISRRVDDKAVLNVSPRETERANSSGTSNRIKQLMELHKKKMANNEMPFKSKGKASNTNIPGRQYSRTRPTNWISSPDLNKKDATVKKEDVGRRSPRISEQSKSPNNVRQSPHRNAKTVSPEPARIKSETYLEMKPLIPATPELEIINYKVNAVSNSKTEILKDEKANNVKEPLTRSHTKNAKYLLVDVKHPKLLTRSDDVKPEVPDGLESQKHKQEQTNNMEKPLTNDTTNAKYLSVDVKHPKLSTRSQDVKTGVDDELKNRKCKYEQANNTKKPSTGDNTSPKYLSVDVKHPKLSAMSEDIKTGVNTGFESYKHEQANNTKNPLTDDTTSAKYLSVDVKHHKLSTGFEEVKPEVTDGLECQKVKHYQTNNTKKRLPDDSTTVKVDVKQPKRSTRSDDIKTTISNGVTRMKIENVKYKNEQAAKYIADIHPVLIKTDDDYRDDRLTERRSSRSRNYSKFNNPYLDTSGSPMSPSGKSSPDISSLDDTKVTFNLYDNLKLRKRKASMKHSADSSSEKDFQRDDKNAYEAQSLDDLKLTIRVADYDDKPLPKAYSNSSSYHSVDKLLGNTVSGSSRDDRTSYLKDTKKKKRPSSYEDSNDKRKLQKCTDDIYDELWRQGSTNPYFKYSDNQASPSTSKNQRYESIHRRSSNDSSYSKRRSSGGSSSGNYWRNNRGTSRRYPDSTRSYQDSGYSHQDSSYSHQDSGYSHQDSGYSHPDARSSYSTQHSSRDSRDAGHFSKKSTGGGRTPSSGSSSRTTPAGFGSSSSRTPQSSFGSSRPQATGSTSSSRPQAHGSTGSYRPQTPGSSRPQASVSTGSYKPQTPCSTSSSRVHMPSSTGSSKHPEPGSTSSSRLQTPNSTSSSRQPVPGSSRLSESGFTGSSRQPEPGSTGSFRGQAPGSTGSSRPQESDSTGISRTQSSSSHSSANSSPQQHLSEEKRNKLFEDLRKCVQTQVSNSKRNDASSTDWCKRIDPLLWENNGHLGLNGRDS